MIVQIKQGLKPLYNAAVESLSHISDPVYLQWYFRESKRLLQFKDRHAGEKCFIIGNGPSLNKMDLSPLKDRITFGLNKIYLIFDKVDLNLKYHVAVNPFVIQQSAREFEMLTCPSFLSMRAAYNVVKSKANIYKVCTGAPFSFQSDLSKTLCEGYTVTYVAMQLAFYMGFREVFLIGVDHNFSYKGKPNEKQLLEGDDPNHFIPNYFGGQNWNLPDLEGSELAYHLAKFHFERDGRSIYDATVGGKLNIFPKVSYELALENCQKK